MNDRFGSTARDFAAGIVTREGGTPEDVRELSYGPDLDRIVSDHRAEFDWNTVPGMGARVRDWYAEQFPDDPLGVMIAPDVTFAQTVESLHGGDVYDRLGVGESVVRERVFAELSARIGCGYDDIYDAWLNGDGLDPRLVSDPDPEPERRFGIDDVEMRRSATWPGGPHVLSAELPDGRILGHVIPQEGEWLWRLADETEWHAPRPVEGNVARFIDQGGREAAILPSKLQAVVYENRRVRTADGGWTDDPRGPVKTTVQLFGNAADTVRRIDMRQGDPVIAGGSIAEPAAYASSKDGQPDARNVINAQWLVYDSILYQRRKERAAEAEQRAGSSPSETQPATGEERS